MSEDYDLAFPTVDVVPYMHDSNEILLGRKNHQDGWRMIGGFFDVRQDKSFEDAAKRELKEEAGDFDCEQMRYVLSSIVNDPRYKERKDKIVTSVFVTKVWESHIQAGDDIHEVAWFKIDKLPKIVDEHKHMLKMAIYYIFDEFV